MFNIDWLKNKVKLNICLVSMSYWFTLHFLNFQPSKKLSVKLTSMTGALRRSIYVCPHVGILYSPIYIILLMSLECNHHVRTQTLVWTMDSECVCVGNHAVLHAIQRAIHATNPYQFDNSWKHNLIINAQTHGFMEIDFNLYFLYMYRHTVNGTYI